MYRTQAKRVCLGVKAWGLSESNARLSRRERARNARFERIAKDSVILVAHAAACLTAPTLHPRTWLLPLTVELAWSGSCVSLRVRPAVAQPPPLPADSSAAGATPAIRASAAAAVGEICAAHPTSLPPLLRKVRARALRGGCRCARSLRTRVDTRVPCQALTSL